MIDPRDREHVRRIYSASLRRLVRIRTTDPHWNGQTTRPALVREFLHVVRVLRELGR